MPLKDKSFFRQQQKPCNRAGLFLFMAQKKKGQTSICPFF
jgi:hypothetical protein